MESFYFNYWPKEEILNYKKYKGFYLGSEACPEFFFRNIEKIKEIAEKIRKDKKKVLVIPPLFGKYYKKIKEIKKIFELFDEVSINDYGTFSFILKEELINMGIKVNIGRNLIKSKTGMLKEEELKIIKKENLEELKEIFIPKFLKKFEDKINLLEINPLIQGLKLKKEFKYSLFWPYVLNSITLMCWSNAENFIKRLTNCKTICKKSLGKFFDNEYILIGNQTLFENNLEFSKYFEKIDGKDNIKRVVIQNI